MRIMKIVGLRERNEFHAYYAIHATLSLVLLSERKRLIVIAKSKSQVKLVKLKILLQAKNHYYFFFTYKECLITRAIKSQIGKHFIVKIGPKSFCNVRCGKPVFKETNKRY